MNSTEQSKVDGPKQSYNVQAYTVAFSSPNLISPAPGHGHVLVHVHVHAAQTHDTDVGAQSLTLRECGRVYGYWIWKGRICGSRGGNGNVGVCDRERGG